LPSDNLPLQTHFGPCKIPFRFFAHFKQYVFPQVPQVIHFVAKLSGDIRTAMFLLSSPYPVSETDIKISQSLHFNSIGTPPILTDARYFQPDH
jgi:hypothetical protein